jgi:hypothetical protein
VEEGLEMTACVLAAASLLGWLEVRDADVAGRRRRVLALTDG